MRDYSDVEIEIENTYKKGRATQTLEFVKKMHQKYLTFDTSINIHSIFNKINEFVDKSDPDITLSNYHHAVQTAEGIRADGHPEWFQLVGLIHDIGKIIFVKGCDEDGTSINTQWGIVGDTFIVGCKLPNKLVYSKFNKLNPDMNNSKLNSKLGIYNEGCGLNNVLCSWGHDEYLYQILKKNKIDLPEEALYIIRFHSLYAHHNEASYDHLMNDYDKKMIGWLKLFNKYDLYTKKDEAIVTPKIEKYYQNMLDKYFKTDLLI
jgi:inositol oxygenase